MAINLWLGLYNAPGEWPWSYMFLVVLQLIFLINPPGRSLGVDALAWLGEGSARTDASVPFSGCLRGHAAPTSVVHHSANDGRVATSGQRD
jgi:hypothetical protein